MSSPLASIRENPIHSPATPLGYLHHFPRRPRFLAWRDVQKAREVHEAFLLWRKRASVGGVVREVRCSLDHLGEDFYELRLLSGSEVLLAESFRDMDELLVRAGELRKKTTARRA